MSERKGLDGASKPHHHHQGCENPVRPISFPTHNSPRTWLLTSAFSPLHTRLMRVLLAHGDHVVTCLAPSEMNDEHRSAEFRGLVSDCKSGRRGFEGWRDRIRSVRCDGRVMSQCGAAVAEAAAAFGGIDILLCCSSEMFVGTVEELSTTPSTQSLVREQFDAIFFSQVNFIKATLPLLRARQTGHIVVLSSTGGHIGFPGLGAYTAATWALEGFCDSLAYEVAPFNIKVTIVQPNKETQALTNRIVFAPRLEWYAYAGSAGSAGGAPGQSRGESGMEEDDEGGGETTPAVGDLLIRVLNQHPDTAVESHYQSISWDGHDAAHDSAVPSTPQFSSTSSPTVGAGTPAALPPVSNEEHPSDIDPPSDADAPVVARYPRLSPSAVDRLVMETVHALAAIGGHESPPTRHIVGFDGAAAVREKQRTVMQEIESFIDASLAVDNYETELGNEARGERGSAVMGEGSGQGMQAAGEEAGGEAGEARENLG